MRSLIDPESPHRAQLALFRNGARAEDFRPDDRYDWYGECLGLADWLDVREKVSGAFNDPSRLAEDAQRGPPTVVCPTTPDAFHENAHWPWENYLNRRQMRDRKRRNETTKLAVKTKR
jgi:hypothetical protein